MSNYTRMKYREDWATAEQMGLKHEAHQELDDAMEAFLAKGGKVTKGKLRAADKSALLNRGISVK